MWLVQLGKDFSFRRMRSLPIKSREDIERIKQRYRENKNYRDLLIFLLSINTGAKLVNLLKLTVADIKEGKPFISQNANSDSVNKEIKSLIETLTNKRKDNEPLFKTINGKFLDRIQVYRNFKEICKDLNLGEKYSATSWRKTFGYHYYKQYGDLTFLQWKFNQARVEETLKFIDVDIDLSSRFQTEFSL